MGLYPQSVSLFVSCSVSNDKKLNHLDFSATIVAVDHIHRMGQTRWVCIRALE